MERSYPVVVWESKTKSKWQLVTNLAGLDQISEKRTFMFLIQQTECRRFPRIKMFAKSGKYTQLESKLSFRVSRTVFMSYLAANVVQQ